MGRPMYPLWNAAQLAAVGDMDPSSPLCDLHGCLRGEQDPVGPQSTPGHPRLPPVVLYQHVVTGLELLLHWLFMELLSPAV